MLTALKSYSLFSFHAFDKRSARPVYCQGIAKTQEDVAKHLQVENIQPQWQEYTTFDQFGGITAHKLIEGEALDYLEYRMEFIIFERKTYAIVWVTEYTHSIKDGFTQESSILRSRTIREVDNLDNVFEMFNALIN